LKTFFTVLFILLSVLQVSAQENEKNIDKEWLYWLRVNPTISFQNNWSLNGEIEVRRFMFPERRNQVLLPRLTAYKQLKNVKLGVGFLYLRQSLPTDNNAPNIEIRPELRSHFDAILQNTWSQSRVQVTHRYRFEQRTKKNNIGVQLTDGWNTNFRFRYRVQFGIPLNSTTGAGSLSLIVLDEIMINMGDDIVRNTFDQNRFYIGGSIKLRDDVVFKTGVLNWFQQLSSGDDFRSHFIVRSTLTYSL